jgi:hypothetical protein
VVLAVIAGSIFVRGAYTTLRDQGPAFWPLSLMLCVLAAASWMLTVRLVRSRRAARGSTPSEPLMQTTEHDQSAAGELPLGDAPATPDGPSPEP